MKAPIVFAIALTAALHAQELLPELQPIAVKHKADIAAIESQKAAAIAHTTQSYVSSLDAAEKAASGAGRIAIVAALTKEREAANNGSLVPEVPSDLPKSIQANRKSCEDAIARVTKDFALREQRVNGDYLRTLTTLQDRTPLNSELAKQLASEKVKLLQGDPGTNANIINSTWIWWGGQTITFQNGGKVRWSNGQTWTWEPGSDANTIKGETTAHQPFTITFNPDFKTGMIQGAVNGETHRVQK